MSRKWRKPTLYDDPPGTIVTPAKGGYESVLLPSGRETIRRPLSPAGQRKHVRLDALAELGYEVVSTKGAGQVVHPSRPWHFYSVAAAARHEGQP